MIPVGYMAKRIAQRPDWLKASAVKDIFSVSSCVSNDFMDYVKLWHHNGYWFFDNPQIIQKISHQNDIDITDCMFFYYEVYEKEFDEEQKQWLSFKPEEFPTNVIPPRRSEFHGYDVVTFSMGTNPECSPLSCNHLAAEIRTNPHCLLVSLAEAKKSLEAGRFDHSEPGPFRIFAVHAIDPGHWLDSI